MSFIQLPHAYWYKSLQGSALLSIAEGSKPFTIGGGALGVSAPLCEVGAVCVVYPRAALAKTAKTKALPMRLILAPIFPKRTLPRAASIIPCI